MHKPLQQLIASSGTLRTGSGLVSGVVALALATLCALAVLAFHFPQYLTTPELRAAYDVDLLRQILLAALVVSGALSVLNSDAALGLAS